MIPHKYGICLGLSLFYWNVLNYKTLIVCSQQKINLSPVCFPLWKKKNTHVFIKIEIYYYP